MAATADLAGSVPATITLTAAQNAVSLIVTGTNPFYINQTYGSGGGDAGPALVTTGAWYGSVPITLREDKYGVKSISIAMADTTNSASYAIAPNIIPTQKP